MIALDTNLLARLLLRDDARQYARVRHLLAQEQDFTAPVTVMLELVWVLKVNDCSPQDIVRGIRLLLGLPNFKPQQADALRQALQWYAPRASILPMRCTWPRAVPANTWRRLTRPLPARQASWEPCRRWRRFRWHRQPSIRQNKQKRHPRVPFFRGLKRSLRLKPSPSTARHAVAARHSLVLKAQCNNKRHSNKKNGFQFTQWLGYLTTLTKIFWARCAPPCRSPSGPISAWVISTSGVDIA